MKFPRFGKFGRYAFCILLVAAIFLLYEARLFQWQVLEGDFFEEQSLNDRTDVIQLDAARGEILDRNGQVLAGNRTTYDIIFNNLYDVSKGRNAKILKVIDLLEERGEEWRDVLPIVLDENGEYQFAPDQDDEIAEMKEMLRLAEYATAQECMDELAKTYGCEGFSSEDTRTVASVRYSMWRDGYSRTNPYVVARDVSLETVGVISQRAEEWVGVEPRVSVARYYGEDGYLAPHVVGHVGLISQEQLERAEENGTAYDYKDNISGYRRTDSLGQDGLEAAFESQLRGSRGTETIYTDDTGAVQKTAVTTQPKEGSTVYTTLDSDLQRVANLSLKKNIEGNTLAANCTSGAAVVLNVKDFGVMACSSYPTFDMNRFSSASYYNQLLKDESNPMYNRALQGIYVPGSIFKPMVALAALQESVIGADTSYVCDGSYKLADLDLECLCDGGTRDVYSGLAKSCNTFFCSVGVSLGIRKIDAYAEYFGLGETTGVELTESKGIIANRQEYADRHGGEIWTDGVTAQAAIGQSDNQFTPIQLATYCATIANGGKRMQAHFLNKLTDYTREETIKEYQPVELFDAGLSSDVLGVVREGMIGTASYGTASTVFGDYPVSIACKTGTAETSRDDSKEPNISFICYAPAEDPEIAVAVMLEYGNKGPYAQNVAKDILDQYFGYYTWDADGNRYDQQGNLVNDKGEVLKTKEKLDEEKAQQEKREQNDFLNSALEEGSSSQADPAGSQPDASSQSSDPSGFDRGDIPTVPYTGESTSAPESSAPGDGTSSAAPSSGKPVSPYYSGGG